MDASIDRYLNFLSHERRLAILTVKSYRRDLELLSSLAVDRKGGQTRALDTFTETDIRRFAAAALHSKGLSPKTLARYRTRLPL